MFTNETHQAELMADEYVIWSYEHNAFWASGRIGYVTSLDYAGRYSKAEADEIVNDANIVSINEHALLLLPVVLPARARSERTHSC